MNLISKVGDQFSIGMAFVCAVHCFVSPVLIALAPSAEALYSNNDENFHRYILFAVIPTSLISLSLGCRQHKKKGFLYIALTGLAVLVFAGFWGHQLLGCKLGKYATLSGSMLISFAHIKNYLLCSKASCTEG